MAWLQANDCAARLFGGMPIPREYTQRIGGIWGQKKAPVKGLRLRYAIVSMVRARPPIQPIERDYGAPGERHSRPGLA